MKGRCVRGFIITTVAVLVATVSGCGNDDVEWEVARGTVGAMTGDELRLDDQWQIYRVAAVRSLDEMKTVLNGVRDQTGVDERGRVDELIAKVTQLRREMIAEFDVPPDQRRSVRKRLRDSFDALRSEVDRFLTQHDVDPMEMKKWADVE
ncbi:MAG TPA: hypothetical protein ENI85_03150 [Deltaproteobacteria bacterium]|nr:hypothetical protein [Deltaproteobacteria bacterium]